MIGDTADDFRAAEEIGVAFLGYARSGRNADEMRAAGAELVVGSMRDVLELAPGG